MKEAVYAGSFDPFTKGHEDILTRGLELFDRIHLVIASSSSKKALFSLKEREKLLKKIYKDNLNIIVTAHSGLLVDYANKNSIKFVLRGLRPTGDFAMEFQMATMNRHMSKDIETVFLITGKDYYFLSSSMVKEIHCLGGDISEFLHPHFFDAISEKLK